MFVCEVSAVLCKVLKTKLPSLYFSTLSLKDKISGARITK